MDGEALGHVAVRPLAFVALAPEVDVAAEIWRAPAGSAKLVVVRGEVAVTVVLFVVVDLEVVDVKCRRPQDCRSPFG